MRRDPEFFGGREVELVYIAKLLPGTDSVDLKRSLVSLLRDGHDPRAADVFAKLLSDPDESIREKAQWWLAETGVNEVILLSTTGLWAELYRRGHPTPRQLVETVDFSKGCEQPGQKALHLSFASIFGGDDERAAPRSWRSAPAGLEGSVKKHSRANAPRSDRPQCLGRAAIFMRGGASSFDRLPSTRSGRAALR